MDIVIGTGQQIVFSERISASGDTKCKSYSRYCVPIRRIRWCSAGREVLDYRHRKIRRTGTSDFLEYIWDFGPSLPDYYKTDAHWRQEKLYPRQSGWWKRNGRRVDKGTMNEVVASEAFTGAYGRRGPEMVSRNWFIPDNEVLEDCKVTDWRNGQGDFCLWYGKRPEARKRDTWPVSTAQNHLRVEIQRQSIQTRNQTFFRLPLGQHQNCSFGRGITYSKDHIINWYTLSCKWDVLGDLVDFDGSGIFYSKMLTPVPE